MPRTTKKAERESLMKKRRLVRRKMRAKQRAKRSGVRQKGTSHPHRQTSAMRARRASR